MVRLASERKQTKLIYSIVQLWAVQRTGQNWQSLIETLFAETCGMTILLHVANLYFLFVASFWFWFLFICKVQLIKLGKVKEIQILNRLFSFSFYYLYQWRRKNQIQNELDPWSRFNDMFSKKGCFRE